MKLYKYRNLSDPNIGLGLVERILLTGAFWCARPDTLNDPREFAWRCLYTLSLDTEALLTRVLVTKNGRSSEQARQLVALALSSHGLVSLAEPVVSSMIRQCRDEIGLACFGSTPDNQTLWERYGGSGAGVCIEVEVPSRLLGTQLHPVQYWIEKEIHIDTFLRSPFDSAAAAELYTVSLLAKPAERWQAEAEIRFVSKRQKVNVKIEDSKITRVIIGPAVTPSLRAQLERLAVQSSADLSTI